MSATTELKFRARLQHPQSPMDDSRGALPDPGGSALKARDLGNAFENPDAPREYTDAEMSGMTLMSNSPDAFKGREIRVTHAQPCRFDDHTTNKDHFPGHQPESRPIHVPKAYAPSPAKFSSNTTNKDTFVPHPIPPQQPFAPKPYRHAPAKFDDHTTNKDHFPGHQPEVMTYGPKKAYAPSPAKFSSNTTNKDTHVAFEPPAKLPPIGLWVENNRTEVLIHGGSDLPARASRMFSTTQHGQDSVALRIVQGWSRTASDNKLLGVFEMKGIPPGPPGRAQIRVTLNVDAAGELVVEGINVDTGQVQMARAKAAVR